MIKNNIFSDRIIKKVLDNKPRIILPEQGDPRIDKAIEKMLTMGFEIENIFNFNDSENYIHHIRRKKFTNNWTETMLKKYVSFPINKAMIVLDMNLVDCVIVGATISTAKVIKSAIRIVGVSKKSKWVSSSFFLISPDNQQVFTYADCGVIPDPTSEQLSSIAYEASSVHRLLSNEEPKVAFLSFSTNGSAQHYKVERMRQAVNIFSKKYPQIKCDGEIQFDAAIDSKVSKNKIPNSNLQGNTNVFIFPDLDSANISYKITQYLAGFSAWGPLLNGLNKPINDLSRGCSVEDIINITSVTALQSLLKS